MVPLPSSMVGFICPVLYQTKEMKSKIMTILVLFMVVATETMGQEKKNWLGRRMRQGADSIISSYRKVTTDTNFVSRPLTPWMFRVKTNVSGNDFYITGETAQGNIMETRLKAATKQTIGISASYSGLTITLSFNPQKMFGKSSNTEYRMNYYTNSFGADIAYGDLHDFKAETSLDGHRETFDMTDTRLRGLSAHAYYVFNGRRLSCPAAFNCSWVQRRSAGSVLASVAFYKGKLSSGYDDGTGYLAHDKSISMTHVALGVGYGYNYVIGKHWLIHLSAQPSVILWKNYTLHLLADHSTGEAVPDRLPHSFPEIDILGRVGAIYKWSNCFIGINGVVQRAEVGRHTDMSLQTVIWKGTAYFGIRL